MINQHAHVPLNEKGLHGSVSGCLPAPQSRLITAEEPPKTRQIKHDTSHRGSVLLANLS